ncbi:MAG: exonuclease SbcCD subunit D [Spirochaetales bacterium]|nr:exonuclease SbcCD subunit D [Spirochaetales bacterium]MCF7939064.1 exonuclease SbcCD subunit D [Spirochaetales bacterium]
MRLLHTADWHIGRLFYGIHLTDDQSYLLDQVLDVVRDSNADALLISGDIYDRSVPPVEAVELVDDFLNRMALETGVPVLIIAGNHDSPERLGFGGRFMEKHGIHIAGRARPDTKPVLLEDDDGPVAFHLLPHAAPARIRTDFASDLDADKEQIHTHARAMALQIENALGLSRGIERKVALAHCFIGGGKKGESERPLSIGTVEQVPAGLFSDFTYSALGHLHRRQEFDNGRIQYSGSLMPYSFEESAYPHGLLQIDIDRAGSVATEFVELAPKHLVRIVEGEMAELLHHPSAGSRDYIMARISDDGPVYDAYGKLREVFPNLLNLERTTISGVEHGPVRAAGERDHRSLSDEELFGLFYTEVTGEELSEEERRLFARIVETGLRKEDRL